MEDIEKKLRGQLAAANAEIRRLRTVIDEAYTFLPIDPKRTAGILRQEFIRTVGQGAK